MIRFFIRSVVILFVMMSFATPAMEQQAATFHAKFVANINELHVEVPTDLIEPTIKSHYQYLADRSLTQTERDLYLEMYLRETIKLQYGAFPMALGESGITQESDKTKLVMKLASIPKEARELLVEISSFAHNPKQKNVFKITKSFYKQSVALSTANAFSTSVSL